MPTAPELTILVSGRVLDPGGRPLENVDVVFQGDGMTYGRGPTTDAAGRYRVSLAPGEYQVWFAISHTVFPSNGERVTVSSVHTRMDFTLNGFHVRGSVVDANGAPCRRVIVYTDAGWASHVDAGTYSLFVPGRTQWFAVADEHYNPLLVGSDVSIAADTTIDMQLDRFPLSGSVVGADGILEQGASVASGNTYGDTDRAGTYRLYLPPGVVDLFCFSHDYSVLPRIRGSLTIPSLSSVDFDLRGIQWSGVVRTQGTNTPLSDGYVGAALRSGTTRSAIARTSTTGAFRLVLEPGLSYDLMVRLHDSNVPVYSQAFQASTDTTFELLVPAPPSP